MEQPIVENAKGEWFVNSGEFAFTDPKTGVAFPPRTPVQTLRTGWVDAQPVIQTYKPEVVQEEAAVEVVKTPAKK